MKKRWVKAEGDLDAQPDLFDAIASMHSADEVRELLLDLCTPAELEALTDRWRVVPYLVRGLPYREIHDLTAVSVTTIGRVARCLLLGEGGYQLAARRLELPRARDPADAEPGLLPGHPNNRLRGSDVARATSKGRQR
jgi:TrpR-related protein YerC/YecD